MITPAAKVKRRRARTGLLTCLIATCLPLQAAAQETAAFDAIGAAAEITELNAELNARITAEDIDPAWLSSTRARVTALEARAETCANQAAGEREALERRFEPLADITGDVEPAVMDQRTEIQNLLNDAIARQTQCAGVSASSDALSLRITETQTLLSQQYLSNRGETVLEAFSALPAEIRTWPDRLRSSVELELVSGITPLQLLWTLVGAGLVAAAIGIAIRRRFTRWFDVSGGVDAPPRMKYLFPKPLAEYSPLILEGVALVAVLMLAIEDSSFDLLVVRIAAGIMMFGLGCVIIDWATGPLSPSAGVKGLIPDHVGPLRLRLRTFLLTLVASFVVIGQQWLAIRTIAPEVTGRTTMILLVALALLYLLAYFRHIPGLRGRFRLIRNLGSLALVTGVVLLFVGYQNFGGYLIHGVTRTAIALFMLWVLLWIVYAAFDFLIRQDTSTAAQIRSGLGLRAQSGRYGLGFLQLIADVVLWLGFVVYLIYVWDESGTTLDNLIELFVLGKEVGGIRLVPMKIIGGILIFAALIIVIGWMKRWVDRRWLQQIGMERGAREALVTLIGYVGFVVAVLIALAQANVDLGGIAIVSGALALGIGFGMQEIANNFVSGLILLFERPIRTGDFVTVGDVEGFVRSIRIRATEIETLDNQNVLVPNSELVSGQVTNWVLRDTHGRLRVNVGVAYGSDVDKVKEILTSVAHDHKEVITDGSAPAPRALFMGFGDSSLDFELRVRIRRIDRRFSVQSDINFALDKAFREAGITIPFPQRDLHLVSLPGTEAGEQKAPVAKPEPAQPRAGPQPETITRSHREEIELKAGLEEAWQAITDMETVKRWLLHDGSLEPRAGGSWSMKMRDGPESSGSIDIFVPPRRMRLVVAPRSGVEPLPTGPITIDYLLLPVEDRTRLIVTVAGIPATEDYEEDFNRSEARWRIALPELQDIVSRK